ncbi:DUF2149 domain-containing protein [Puteibacter caeruleilacunae]|nr:DUF2149 domain-containing protein [Puteibacter caeruleilacunae]
MKRKRKLLTSTEDNDPLSVLTNLFDVSMVFAVALMVALVARYKMNEMFSKDDFTMVKNPGSQQMEIITKRGEKIETYKASNESSETGNRGKRVGVAYQMENGEIIYVPE